MNIAIHDVIVKEVEAIDEEINGNLEKLSRSSSHTSKE